MSVTYVTGSCQVNHGCDIGCKRFRANEDNEILCAYYGHDVSAHQILGMIQDERMILLVEAAAAELLPIKSTAQEERRGLFQTKPRVPDRKRRISMDEEEPQVVK